MSEPREVQVVALFQGKFGGFGPVTDFRPATQAPSDDDVLTEDGQGNPPPPRATGLPDHPAAAVRPAHAVYETAPSGPLSVDPGDDLASPALGVPEFPYEADAASLLDL